MKIEHKILAKNIHLLIFESQKEITSTFLRFQEHYESPYFKRKIFSIKEFKQWYIKNSPKGIKTGEFTYYSDWNGFNIPSYVLQPFYDGKFNPLSRREKKILDIFKNEQGVFYVIGIHKEIDDIANILKHEIAHGLFYTNENYRHEVLDILSKFNIEPIKKELRLKAGYNEQVLEDEVQAYSFDMRKKLKTPIPDALSKKLIILYKKYLYQNNAIIII